MSNVVESCPECLACKIVKMTAEKPRRCEAGVGDGDDGFHGLGTRMALGRVVGQTQR